MFSIFASFNLSIKSAIPPLKAKSISRFARNTIDTLKHVRDLKEHKVDVYFEKENIHTLELESEMFLTLFSVFAQAESESTSQNVKMGIRAMMKRGEFVGKAECYGYKWNKELKTLEVYEEQAEVVRMIFNWYADGIGTRTISNKLNELGYKTYTGKNFTQQGVREMISNEKYVGDLLCQKYYTISPITHKKQRDYGEKDENGNDNPNVIRFILKIGGDYKAIISQNNNSIDSVSFEQGNRAIPFGGELQHGQWIFLSIQMILLEKQ